MWEKGNWPSLNVHSEESFIDTRLERGKHWEPLPSEVEPYLQTGELGKEGASMFLATLS